ncbi:hypothetical protein D3C84_1134570 [compost metagenome]
MLKNLRGFGLAEVERLNCLLGNLICKHDERESDVIIFSPKTLFFIALLQVR